MIPSLFADFPLQWPPVLTQLFNVQNSVGFTAGSLTSLDCLLSTEKSAIDGDGTDFSFFNAAATTIVIPFAVFLLSKIVRTAIVIRLTRFERGAEKELPHCRPATHHAGGDIELHERGKQSDPKETELADENEPSSSGATVQTSGAEPSNPPKKKKDKKKPGLVSRQFIAAWIVIFVTLQPSLTKAVFGLFSCQKLEDGSYWVQRDMQVGCFSPTHKWWLFYFGIPGVLLYPLGIPLGAALLLYFERNNLETRGVKKKFGFLYSGCDHFPPLPHPHTC